jgi:predicted lipoprotein with Yx(FWY)xxD motif
VSSHFVHPAPPRRRALALAAASAGVLASLAVAAPVGAQSEGPAGEAYTVGVTTSPDLGTFLTGEDGKTLYYFANDTAPGASTCTDTCLDNWPPFMLEEGETLAAGEGLVTGVLTTFPRADGTMQVSYDGRPLYYFAGDQAAGDTNGQGKGDVWYVAAVDGTLNGPAAPADGGLVVNAATGDLGSYLVDADGKTLYFFAKDTAPGASVCGTGGCLESWPVFGPADGQGFAPGEGVTGVLGSFTRTDGAIQATYDGRPLYYFVGDQAAGDTTGQNIGGVWFVAAVDGSLPAPVASEPPAA